MAKTHLPKARRTFSFGTFIQNSRSVGAEQKAIYHNESGAGRRHVIREFFGINAEDEAEIVTRIEASIEAAINKQEPHV